jgi:thymidylate synthase
MRHQEFQYLNLVKRILNSGDKKLTRNGLVYSVFGANMRFSLNKLPLITTKQLAWKTCLKELLWFLSGDTNNKTLKRQGVHIWDANGTREFLDSRGLFHYEEDDLGLIYGHQWRNFNGTSERKGIDQIQNLIDNLKTDPFSRRHIVSAWNPSQLDLMALPPCHILFQMSVNSKFELSCSLYQRSGDVGLGVPFNIASYSILTHLIAHHIGYKTGDFIYNIGDAHIYENHIPMMNEQIKRKPYEFPQLKIERRREKIDEYLIQDFKVENYKYHPKIEMKMIA